MTVEKEHVLLGSWHVCVRIVDINVGKTGYISGNLFRVENKNILLMHIFKLFGS